MYRNPVNWAFYGSTIHAFMVIGNSACAVVGGKSYFLSTRTRKSKTSPA